MIKDCAAAYCCCVAALATLKQQYPARIEAPLPLGSKDTFEVTYSFENGIAICSCGDYFAYAVSADKDFSFSFNGISPEFTSDNEVLIKMIFKAAAKVMNGLYGAKLHLKNR